MFGRDYTTITETIKGHRRITNGLHFCLDADTIYKSRRQENSEQDVWSQSNLLCPDEHSGEGTVCRVSGQSSKCEGALSGEQVRLICA